MVLIIFVNVLVINKLVIYFKLFFIAFFFKLKDLFSGKNCERESLCAKSPCLNNGGCSAQGQNEYFCVCLSKNYYFR